MRKPKIVYYTTPYGYGHLVRANIISNALGDKAEVHLIAAVENIFNLAKNIKYHRIDEIPGMPRLDYEIYYEDKFGKTTDISSGKYIESYRKHFQKFINLVCKISPDLVIVDVTPEFAIYSELLGYKTVQMLITGKRDDLRNKISYSSADHIILPYPEGFTDVSYWSEDVRKKMFCSGAFSRFDGKEIIEKEKAKAKLNISKDKKLIVCTFGRGDLGDVVIDKIKEISKSDKFTHCEFKILENVKNVEDYLAGADCAIIGAGDNTVMENCYYQIPMIMIPLKRRYDEQVSKAEALEKMGAGTMILEHDINSRLEKELLRLIEDCEYINKAKIAQKEFVDGHGADRLADQVLKWIKN